MHHPIPIPLAERLRHLIPRFRGAKGDCSERKTDKVGEERGKRRREGGRWVRDGKEGEGNEIGYPRSKRVISSASFYLGVMFWKDFFGLTYA